AVTGNGAAVDGQRTTSHVDGAAISHYIVVANSAVNQGEITGIVHTDSTTNDVATVCDCEFFQGDISGNPEDAEPVFFILTAENRIWLAVGVWPLDGHVDIEVYPARQIDHHRFGSINVKGDHRAGG